MGDDIRYWLDSIYGNLMDALDRRALTPDARAAARAADPAFMRTDDQWQAFMKDLQARAAARSGMLPQAPWQGIINGALPPRRDNGRAMPPPMIGVRG